MARAKKTTSKKALGGLFDSKEDKVRREYFARYYLDDNVNEIESIINREFGSNSYDEWGEKYGFDASDIPDPKGIYKILEKVSPKTLKKFAERGEESYRERWGADGWSEQLKKLREHGLSGCITTKTKKKMACKKTSRKRTSSARKSTTLNGGVAKKSNGDKYSNAGEEEIRKAVHKLEAGSQGQKLTHKQIKSCIDSYWQAVTEAIARGENVQIKGVGSIRKADINGGKGRTYKVKDQKGKVHSGVVKKQVKIVLSDTFKKDCGVKK